MCSCTPKLLTCISCSSLSHLHSTPSPLSLSFPRLSTPASKYAIVFSLQQERQQWEQELRRCQLAARNPQPAVSVDMHDGYVPTVEVTAEEVEDKDDALLLEEEEEEEEEIEEKDSSMPFPDFLWPVAIPSCRVGSQVRACTCNKHARQRSLGSV